MVIDILALLAIVQLGADTVEAVQALIDIVNGEAQPDYSDLTLEEKTALLKECTKIVANLQLHLSCFPLGYETTLLFDLDGNPVP